MRARRPRRGVLAVGAREPRRVSPNAFWDARGEGLVCRCVTNDIETLITALYVKIDDELGGPRRLGKPPGRADSQLVCPAGARALLGFTSRAHWLRCARNHLAGRFPHAPQQS